MYFFVYERIEIVTLMDQSKNGSVHVFVRFNIKTHALPLIGVVKPPCCLPIVTKFTTIYRI